MSYRDTKDIDSDTTTTEEFHSDLDTSGNSVINRMDISIQDAQESQIMSMSMEQLTSLVAGLSLGQDQFKQNYEAQQEYYKLTLAHMDKQFETLQNAVTTLGTPKTPTLDLSKVSLPELKIDDDFSFESLYVWESQIRRKVSYIPHWNLGSNAVKYDFVLGHLGTKGTVAAAHLQGKDFTSLDSLFTGIRKVLCKENIPAKALVYFQKRIQHEGESLILYCREKIHLFELSFPGEEYKTSRLLCNSFFEGILSVEVKKQLITQNPKGIPTDVEALLQAAIEAESVLERLSSIDKGEKKALKLTNETSMDMSMVQDQACGAMRGKSPRRGHVFNYSRPRKAQFPNPQAGYNFHRRGQQQFERSRYQQTSQRFRGQNYQTRPYQRGRYNANNNYSRRPSRGNFSRGNRGRSGQRGRGQSQVGNQRGCFKCHDSSHWAKDCPNRDVNAIEEVEEEEEEDVDEIIDNFPIAEVEEEPGYLGFIGALFEDNEVIDSKNVITSVIPLQQ